METLNASSPSPSCNILSQVAVLLTAPELFFRDANPVLSFFVCTALYQLVVSYQENDCDFCRVFIDTEVIFFLVFFPQFCLISSQVYLSFLTHLSCRRPNPHLTVASI